MTNEQMKSGRFLRWHKARQKIAYITHALEHGGTVVIATNLKATQYGPKHIGMFKATRTGAYVQHGKRWDCIDYCAIRAFMPEPQRC